MANLDEATAAGDVEIAPAIAAFADAADHARLRPPIDLAREAGRVAQFGDIAHHHRGALIADQVRLHPALRAARILDLAPIGAAALFLVILDDLHRQALALILPADRIDPARAGT